jgi:hypothetical protein
MSTLLSPSTVSAVLAGLALSVAALSACVHGASGDRAAPAPKDASPPRGLLLDERFELARPIPALTTYEQLTPVLEERLEQGGRWHLILVPAADASAEIAGGVATLDILRAGSAWYSVQLAYLPVRLRPAMAYRVRFRATASRPLLTTFDLAHVGDGWKSYSGQRRLELTPEWKQYEVRFETGEHESEERARFEFNFGNEYGSLQAHDRIRIDDVQVIEEAHGTP